MCTTFFYPSSVYIVCVEYDFSVNTYTPEVHNNKFCDLHMYPNRYLDCWPRSQAFREERDGLVHNVFACVNFMNAHVMKNCGNVGKIQRMRKQCVPGLPSPLAEGLGTRLPGLYDVWLCIICFQ